jgi:septal ring factor EnvC (AmiA/AmiB activator)
MFPMRFRLLPTLLIAAATVAGPVRASEDPQADLERVRRSIGALQESVRADMGRRDRLAVQLREAEGQVRDAASRLSDVRRRIAASDRRLAGLMTERRRQEEVLVAQRDALAAQLRSAYVNGREEQLKLLLNQQDPVAIGRMLVYYGYFGKARAGQIATIEDAVRRLEQLAAEEKTTRAALEQLAREQEREVRELDAARGERAAALGQINAQIRTRSDNIAKLRREAASLQKLVDDLRRSLREVPPPDTGQPFDRVRGKLSWPVAGRVVASFGAPRGGGLRWNGVLIAAARGAEIRAPYPGRVVYADWLPGLGLLLIVDHGGSYLSLYGHNEQIYKPVGATVAAGEVIGTVGDSGGREEPGLYFEIRRGARPVDPRVWFARPSP